MPDAAGKAAYYARPGPALHPGFLRRVLDDCRDVCPARTALSQACPSVVSEGRRSVVPRFGAPMHRHASRRPGTDFQKPAPCAFIDPAACRVPWKRTGAALVFADQTVYLPPRRARRLPAAAGAAPSPFSTRTVPETPNDFPSRRRSVCKVVHPMLTNGVVPHDPPVPPRTGR